jgi:hypothetical protein
MDCKKCYATFGAEAGWSPTDTPSSKATAAEVLLLKLILGVPALLLSAVLVFFSAVGGGALTAVPALVLFVAGICLLAARSSIGLRIAATFNGVLLLLSWAVLHGVPVSR